MDDLEQIFETMKNCASYIQGIIGESEGDYFDTQNKSGDMQLKADVKADLLIEHEFKKLSCVKALCSEEKNECVINNPNGRYYIGYDPIDGSSLVEVNMSVGTIFGVYDGEFDGKNLVAAAYVTYGPGIEMVLAHQKAELYVLEYGIFRKKKDIVLKESGKIMAPGGTQKYWYPYHKEMINEFFEKDEYRLRYSGGMVPDCHQILVKGGGLFSYPGTTDKPKGKIRTVFEALPFAFIFEKAGGAAIDGKRRLLDIKPEHYHDTTPCFFGSKKEIQKVLDVYAAHG